MPGQRTTVTRVLSILGGNYGSVNGITVELQPFITKANLQINQALQLMLQMPSLPLLPTNDDLTMMETWLAAYYYSMTDPLQTNQSTAGASASFVTEKLDANRYKAGAIQADPTGVLQSLLNRQFARTFALGPTCP